MKIIKNPVQRHYLCKRRSYLVIRNQVMKNEINKNIKEIEEIDKLIDGERN